MSTWTETPKSTDFNPIFRENYFVVLRENGDYLTRETSVQNYFTTTKNTSTFTSPAKSTTVWTSQTKN